jgi:uncharacterized protein YecE (DUF72 family)
VESGSGTDRRRVGAAAVTGEWAAVAEALPGSVRLGTSSWSFPGWQGLVYDRKATPAHLARHGLAAYAANPLLGAVGVDRTYYAPITAEAFAEYAAVVDDDFRFLVKAASLCTDPYLREEKGRAGEVNELFLDVGFTSEQIVGPYVEGLGTKGGALLFQFPPLGREFTERPEAFADSLADFLSALPPGPVYAVELRDRAVFGRPYVAALRDSGAVHCFSAHPRMPSVGRQRQVVGDDPGRLFVARWMLHSALGYEAAKERYAPFSQIVDEDLKTRESYAELCAEQIGAGRPVIVTANNKAEGSAPQTLYRLASRIVARIADRPA